MTAATGNSAPLEGIALCARASTAAADMDDKSIDIFPWHDQFDTGFPELDDQHRVLVRLLNALANQFAFDPDASRLNQILDELIDYTGHHLRAEEAIWAGRLLSEAEIADHRDGHTAFTDEVRRLQAESEGKPVVAIVGEMLTFVARALSSHILEHDHYFAQIARGMIAGLSPEEARRAAKAEMEGPRRKACGVILDTYDALASNAVKLMREMVERKHAEDSAREGEERFRTIVDQSPLGILLHKEGRVVQINEASIRMFRYDSREEMLRTDVFENIAPEDREMVRERAQRRLHGEHVPSIYEVVGLRRDGTRFPLVLLPRTLHTREGPVIAAFLMDATQAQRARDTERSLNRVIKLLSRCNALLVRAESETALVEDVCRLAVEVGDYRMAWVGYAEHDTKKSIRPITHYGAGADYVASVGVSWGDNTRGQGPSGLAIRSGRSAVTRDIQSDPAWAPWHEAAREHGFEAAIALPLIVEHQTIGMLAIYSDTSQAFHPEEVALLEELAYDLAFGIQSLRLREAKETALQELKLESDKNRALLHNASDGVHILDEDGYLIEASDSFFAMLGYTRAELMGKHITAWHAGPESPRELDEGFRHMLQGKERVAFQTLHRRRDGSLLDVEISTFPLIVAGKRMMFNSSRDVTESQRIRTRLEETTQHLRQLLADFDATLEAERTHIAREVHDELGQILTSLGFAISTIRVKYGKENPELMQIAREMSAHTDRALQVARNVAEHLRPAALDMGIVAAIEWLCTKAHAQTPLNCHFQVAGELGDMDQAQVDAVFRIAQESVTNAMRHSGAGQVAISLALHDDGLHLTVYDDGRGFDPAQVMQRKSFGLAGMEERVRGVGGRFFLTSAPDEGTTVVAHMPYRRSSSSSRSST